MKIVFMGTSDFAVPALEKLNENFDVSLVVTKEDKPKGRGKKIAYSPVKERALELGLEIFQPENINSEDSLEILRNEKADIFVVAAYGQILKEDVLNTPKYFSINIHGSILPKLRGAAPVNRAIINGDVKAGISIMKMDLGLDSGPVARISETNVEDKKDFELYGELAELGATTLIDLLKEGIDNINFVEQDHDNKTYAHKIEKETGKIDFTKMTSKEIFNLARGLYSLGGAYFNYSDNKVKIYDLEIVEDKSNKKPGTVLEGEKKILIKTIDGAIEIRELQFPNKKKMDSKSFLAGNKFEENILLS